LLGVVGRMLVLVRLARTVLSVVMMLSVGRVMALSHFELIALMSVVTNLNVVFAADLVAAMLVLVGSWRAIEGHWNVSTWASSSNWRDARLLDVVGVRIWTWTYRRLVALVLREAIRRGLKRVHFVVDVFLSSRLGRHLPETSVESVFSEASQVRVHTRFGRTHLDFTFSPRVFEGVFIFNVAPPVGVNDRIQ